MITISYLVCWGELIAAFPGEKQKILELPADKIVPALTRFLESI